MSHPPRWLESLVSALLPPVSREHVLGDLSERYRSPGRYLADALQALPGVIASQMRRSVCWLTILVMGYYTALVLHLCKMDWHSFIVPTLSAVLALILRDIYRAPLRAVSTRALRWQAALDAVAVMASILLSQATLAAFALAWMLPGWAPRFWTPVICGAAAYYVKLQNVPEAVWLHLLPARSLSAQGLMAEAQAFEAVDHSLRRNLSLHLLAARWSGPIILLALAVKLISEPPWPAAMITPCLGMALCAAGELFSAAWLQRELRRDPPLHRLGFAHVLSLYRQRLEQHQRVQRESFWWRLLTLVGLALWNGPDPWIKSIPLVSLACLLWHSQAPCIYERRLQQLATLDERIE